MSDSAETVAPLTDQQRSDAADMMTEHGFNKCFDCCLVPSCSTCGPCIDHDGSAEARAVLAWAGVHLIDGSGAGGSMDA